MKNVFIIFVVLLSTSFLVLSCQNTKEAEKSTDMARSEQTSGQGQQEQLKSTANQDCLKNLTGGPLTKEEQEWFDKIGGSLQTPSQFGSQAQAKKYLRIMIKGNHKTNTWYIPQQPQPEERIRWIYSLDIETAIDALDPTDNDVFMLLVEVLKTKSCYPEAIAKAARKIKFTKDKSVIPILQDAVKSKNLGVQLEAAGSLLVLGDSDTALPILEKFVDDGYSKALYYLFSGPGEIIDERGYRIVEKALNNSRAEVRVASVRLLFDAKKITKEKAEGIAVEMVQELRDKTLKDYGLMLDPKEVYKIIPLPGSRIADLDHSTQQKYSDSRACEHAINLLSNLESKNAVPVLKYISEKNSALGCVCKDNNAKAALSAIIGGRK